ncbi:MAG: hypothetical protein V1816_04420 [Pseudomonadota bacterium]
MRNKTCFQNSSRAPGWFFRALISLAAAAMLVSGCCPFRPACWSSPGKTVVAFVYKGPGRQVCLAGDFNHWSRDACCLEKDGEGWVIEVTLDQGSYRYGFWVDGAEFVPDPEAVLQEEDGFGRWNSILFVN